MEGEWREIPTGGAFASPVLLALTIAAPKSTHVRWTRLRIEGRGRPDLNGDLTKPRSCSALQAALRPMTAKAAGDLQMDAIVRDSFKDYHLRSSMKGQENKRAAKIRVMPEEASYSVTIEIAARGRMPPGLRTLRTPRLQPHRASRPG